MTDNVARALSIVFNVIFTFIFLGKKTSVMACTTLVIIMVGFYVGIDGEVNFSLIGTSAGVLSSVFVSLNSIFTARVLPVVDNDKSLLLYYNNLNATLLFMPLIVLFEHQVIVDNAAKLFSSLFWTVMTITGCMGFAIGLVTVMQVRICALLCVLDALSRLDCCALLS
jgi:GDP-fucose transporter C1